MNEYQRQTDGQAGKVVGGTVSLGGSTQHNKYKHAGEDNLGQQTAHDRNALLQVVGTCAVHTHHVGGEQVEQCRADKGTDHLEQDVHAAILGAHASAQEAAQRDGGIDVATADAANGIGHGNNCETKGQCRAHDSGNVVNGITTQTHGNATAHQNEDHRADHFS